MVSDTKERILKAALEMFSQNGYVGTNIDATEEIVDRAIDKAYSFEAQQASIKAHPSSQ